MINISYKLSKFKMKSRCMLKVQNLVKNLNMDPNEPEYIQFGTGFHFSVYTDTCIYAPSSYIGTTG